MKKKLDLIMIVPYIGCIIGLIAVLVVSKISKNAGFYLYFVGAVVIIGSLIIIVSKPTKKD